MTKKMQILKIICASVVFCITAIMIFAGSAFAISTAYDNNTKIAVGNRHSLMIDNGGNVWSLGDNEFGQLGDGSTNSSNAPIKVYSSTWKGKAVSVAAGLTQSLALLQNGTVLQWGNSSVSQKPIAFVDGKATAIFAGGQICMAILDNGKAVIWSDNYSQQIYVRDYDSSDPLDNITEISIGSNEFMLVKTSDNGGTVYQMTDSINPVARKVPVFSRSEINEFTEADYPQTNLSDVVRIAAGKDFGTAVLSNGDVYTWGNNDYDGIEYNKYYDEDFRTSAKKVSFTGLAPSKLGKFLSSGADFIIVGGDNNDFYGWGNSFSYKLDKTKSDFYYIPVTLSLNAGKVSQLYCGESYSMAMSSDGSFYIWGEDKPLQKLVFKENLAKVANPVVSSSFVSKNSMTISWNPADYYTEMAIGYSISYKMPNGEETRTQVLPITQTQITLQSLQPATNYLVSLTVYGKTGFNQTFPPATIQTLKPDVTVTPTPIPTVTVTKAIISTSSDVSEGKADDRASVLGIIIVVLIFLLLALAIAAIIFVWKKIEKQDKPGAKSVRIPVIERIDDEDEVHGAELLENSDENANIPNTSESEFSGGIGGDDEDVKIAASPSGKRAISSIIASGTAVNIDATIHEDISEMNSEILHDNYTGKEVPSEDNQIDQYSQHGESDAGNEEEDSEEIADDEFIIRHPKAHNTDDDDDFIIRKP